MYEITSKMTSIKIVFMLFFMMMLSPIGHCSDLSDFLWGGKESQTYVSQPYTPYVTQPSTTQNIAPLVTNDTTVLPQTQMMLGTPGATTIPLTGVTSTNGVANYISGTGTPVYYANHAVNPATIYPFQTVTVPDVGYEWTYSTIKDVTYEPVTVYNPLTGTMVTGYREKKTESVLPWLHRKQVVRNKPVVSQQPAIVYPETTNNPAVAAQYSNMPVAVQPSPQPTAPERPILDRIASLAPVSALPSVSAETVIPQRPLDVADSRPSLPVSSTIVYSEPIAEKRVVSDQTATVSDSVTLYPVVEPSLRTLAQSMPATILPEGSTVASTTSVVPHSVSYENQIMQSNGTAYTKETRVNEPLPLPQSPRALTNPTSPEATTNNNESTGVSAANYPITPTLPQPIRTPSVSAESSVTDSAEQNIQNAIDFLEKKSSVKQSSVKRSSNSRSLINSSPTRMSR